MSPVTEESLIMKAEKEDRERKSRYQERQAERQPPGQTMSLMTKQRLR